MTVKNATKKGSRSVPSVGEDAFEILENDHDAVKELFAQLSDAAGDRAAILLELKGILTVHNATEENIVYPALRFLAARGTDSDKLYHQQDEAEAALWKIDAMVNGDLEDASLEQSITDLQAAVLTHIRKEEQTEFPHLRDALKGEAGRRLTESVRRFREQFALRGNPAEFTPSRSSE